MAQDDIILNNINTPSPQTTERYDYSSSTTIYVGQAPLGTAEATAIWTITKYDLASSSAASGKVAINTAWDDRAIGTYN